MNLDMKLLKYMREILFATQNSNTQFWFTNMFGNWAPRKEVDLN
jgi:hypothetical protein